MMKNFKKHDEVFKALENKFLTNLTNCYWFSTNNIKISYQYSYNYSKNIYQNVRRLDFNIS